MYDQATAEALRRDFDAFVRDPAREEEKLYVEGQLELLIPWEPLLTGEELIATTAALQSAASQAAGRCPPDAATGTSGREFDDWWASVQSTAGREVDTRFLQNGDIPLWRELEETGHEVLAGSLGMSKSTSRPPLLVVMQRPFLTDCL